MDIIKRDAIDSFATRSKEHYDFFDCMNAVLSPKQYFLPPNEELFNFNKKKEEVEPGRKIKPFVLFGLSVDDLKAIAYLDEIMRGDHFYNRRRTKAILIGVVNDTAPTGDIILRKLKNGDYEISQVTDKGKRFVKNLDIEIVKADGQEYDTTHNEEMPELKKLLLDPELLKDAVAWSWEGMPKLWDDLQKKCLGCGICTYVCPLCHCFSMEDKIEIDDSACKRCRLWSACTLPEFAKIAGGHNFHGELKERYYNWFYHKFVRGYLEFGKAQCVACGKCKKMCPAKIDIEEILMNIVNEYKK